VHYATVTTLSATGKPEAAAKGEKWRPRYNTRQHARFVNETVEATMLHTKAIVAKETKDYHSSLQSKHYFKHTYIGVEYPPGSDSTTTQTVEINGESFYPNCYPVEWIEKHWSPKLNEAINSRNAMYTMGGVDS